MSRPFKVLISGNGITGSVAAYWLARASTRARPIHVTLIDRAPSVLDAGQGLDIEGSARDIVSRMGVLDEIKSSKTLEKGSCCVNRDNTPYAVFPGGGLTQDIEIMRGELCRVLTSTIKSNSNVSLKYNRQITKLIQSPHAVRASVSHTGTSDGSSSSPAVEEEEYDAIIGADGVRSKTRYLMLEPSATADCLKPRDMFVAYYSVPPTEDDMPYARWQHALQGRSVVIRPVTDKFSSIYMIAVGKHPTLERTLLSRDSQEKRRAWAEAFADVDFGLFPRALREMQVSSNFYSDQITQVKLPTWHQGRCAVVGDAAWAPGPITGQGTQLAVLGGYILAGELSSSLEDPERAFEQYEKRFRSHVTKMQQVPLFGRAPELFSPQTRLGTGVLQSILWLAAASRVSKWFPEDFGEVKFPLPEYKFGAI